MKRSDARKSVFSSDDDVNDLDDDDVDDDANTFTNGRRIISRDCGGRAESKRVSSSSFTSFTSCFVTIRFSTTTKNDDFRAAIPKVSETTTTTNAFQSRAFFFGVRLGNEAREKVERANTFPQQQLMSLSNGHERKEVVTYHLGATNHMRRWRRRKRRNHDDLDDDEEEEENDENSVETRTSAT